MGYLIERVYFSIGLDKQFTGLYSVLSDMEKRNLFKKAYLKLKNRQKGVNNFASVQFQTLLDRNLGIPIKTFQL